MTIQLWRVQVRGVGVMAREVIIEAVNPPEAKRFAEARYPGCDCFVSGNAR